MVPQAGLEPARAKAHKILSLARLPIPPPRHKRVQIVKKHNYLRIKHRILYYNYACNYRVS